MVVRRQVDEILISLSTIAILLGIEKIFSSKIITVSLIMIAVGIFALTFAKAIFKESSPIKKFLTRAAGLVVLYGGIDMLMTIYVDYYWWVYLIGGILLYSFHNKISEWI